MCECEECQRKQEIEKITLEKLKWEKALNHNFDTKSLYGRTLILFKGMAIVTLIMLFFGAAIIILYFTFWTVVGLLTGTFTIGMIPGGMLEVSERVGSYFNNLLGFGIILIFIQFIKT